MKKIVVESYNPKWVHGFHELKEAYLTHIRPDLKIEHIGGTSIPGAFARPILDIDIVVQTEGEAKTLIGALGELGYIYEDDHHIKGMWFFRRSLQDVPLMYEHHSKWLSHHLFVCLENSLAHRYHMAIKSYLMNHEEAIEEYNALKLALSHKYPHDKDKYLHEKTPFIARILSVCEFTSEEIEEISKSMV